MKLQTAILTWLFLGLIGSLAAAAAVRSVMRGEYLSAVVALGGIAFCCGLSIPLIKVVRGTVTPRVDVDDTGTTIRPDRGIDLPMHVAMLGAVVACALIVVLFPQGKLDIPFPPGMRRNSLPFTSAAIVVMVAPFLWRYVRRGSSKYLRLTLDGFEIVEGWGVESGDWEKIQDVTHTAPGREPTSPGDIAFVMVDESAHILAAGGMTPNGSALRELVRFYWQHPDHRDELTSRRAAERLSALL